MIDLILAVLLAQATPAVTPTAPAPVAASLDPVRVAAAHDVIDVLMPPATREQMIGSMITPMLANIRQGMMQDPKMAALMGQDPAMRAAFDQFIARQNDRTIETLRAELPGMITAMTNAYARRFDVGQLRDIKAFFLTPTGRAYMQAAMTIMSDPDVAQWQRSMMSRTLGHIQEDIAAFVDKVVEAAPEKKTP